MNPLENQVPGLREALDREASTRDESFLDLPRLICGFEALPLTPRHLLLLNGVSSPFICGGVPLPEDVALYLWILSPQFLAGQSFRARWRRSRFLRRARSIEYIPAVEAIRDHLDDAFMDAPSGEGGTAQPVACLTASLVDLFASEYGWPQSETLSTPLARLWQYRRLITRRDNPKAVLVNRYSARVTGDWLAELNAANKRN